MSNDASSGLVSDLKNALNDLQDNESNQELEKIPEDELHEATLEDYDEEADLVKIDQ